MGNKGTSTFGSNISPPMAAGSWAAGLATGSAIAGATGGLGLIAIPAGSALPAGIYGSSHAVGSATNAISSSASNLGSNFESFGSSIDSNGNISPNFGSNFGGVSTTYEYSTEGNKSEKKKKKFYDTYY